MKKLSLFLVVIALTVSALASCGGTAKELSISIKDLLDKAVEKIQEEGEMYSQHPDTIYDEYQIEQAYYEEGEFRRSTDGMSVEAIAFFKAVDNEKAEIIEQKLAKYREEARKTSENYYPQHKKAAEEGVVVRSGNYVYMVISNYKSDITKVINEYFK